MVHITSKVLPANVFSDCPFKIQITCKISSKNFSKYSKLLKYQTNSQYHILGLLIFKSKALYLNVNKVTEEKQMLTNENEIQLHSNLKISQ